MMNSKQILKIIKLYVNSRPPWFEAWTLKKIWNKTTSVSNWKIYIFGRILDAFLLQRRIDFYALIKSETKSDYVHEDSLKPLIWI